MRLLLALSALLVLAPAASAAKLERSGGTITFTAGAGETNYVSAGRSFFPRSARGPQAAAEGVRPALWATGLGPPRVAA